MPPVRQTFRFGTIIVTYKAVLPKEKKILFLHDPYSSNMSAGLLTYV
jgi:hypothetical protein